MPDSFKISLGVNSKKFKIVPLSEGRQEMCYEIDSIDYDRSDIYSSERHSGSVKEEKDFGVAIFRGGGRKGVLPISASFPFKSQQSIEDVGKKFLRLDASGKVEVGGKISWGGDKGVEASGYGKAEVRDDRGSYAKVEIEQKSDGTGNATVSAGHEKK